MTTRPYSPTATDDPALALPAELPEPLEFIEGRVRGWHGYYAPVPVEQRFWKHVDKSSNGGCWNWTAASTKQGYGQITINKKRVKASRVSWALHFGEIPDGLWVLHKCDNPSCVNPDHLYLGTVRENVRDMIERGRGKHTNYRGEEHWNSKFAEQDIREIRTEYAAGGITMTELGHRYGVTKTTIRLIIRRRTWRHVE